MLNIVINGYIYDKDNNPAGFIYYQPYFHKVNPTSSPSKWGAIRQTEHSGYYNFNLADSDLLGPEGSASSGDIVLVVAWMGTDANRNALTHLQWGAIRITLTSDDIYTINFQIKDNIGPNNDFSISTTDPFYRQDISISPVNIWDDAEHLTDHKWFSYDAWAYQWKNQHSQLIYAINDIDYCRYWLDYDNHPSEYTQLNDKQVFHGHSSYWIGGHTYTIRACAYDKSINNKKSNCKQWTISIHWNNADAVLNINPTHLYPGQVLHMYNNSTSSDSENPTPEQDKFSVYDNGWIVIADWADWGRSPIYVFQNPGSHQVKLDIRWHDGFEWKYDSDIKTIIQDTWQDIDADFSVSNFNPMPGEQVTFTNITPRTNWSDYYSDDSTQWVEYEQERWLINGQIIRDWSTNWHEPLTYIFPYAGNFTVRLEIKWWDGFQWKYDYKEKIIHQQTWTIQPGFYWNPIHPERYQQTEFIPDIKGDVDQITKVNYYIDGTLVMENLSKDEHWFYTFEDKAEYYMIKQRVYYNDGFEEKYVELEKQLQLLIEYEYNVSASVIYKFITDNEATNYHWTLYDEFDNIIIEGSGTFEGDFNVFYYTFTKEGMYKIKLIADGQEHMREFEVEIPELGSSIIPVQMFLPLFDNIGN